VKTSIKFFFVILYVLDLPYKEFLFFVFQKGRKGKKILCRQQFGYQVLFSSVFLRKPLILVIIILTVIFYAIITIIIIHWELLSVCVYKYRDDVFILKGKDCLSGPAEI